MKEKKQIICQTVFVLFFTFSFALFPQGNRIEKVYADHLEEEIDGDEGPSMPDLTHESLAIHAAQSHGNTPQQVEWIAQGSYAEDHNVIPTLGWHGWDPDTNDYWWSPTGCGPAPIRANHLFWEAVEMYETDQEKGWILFGKSLHLLQDLGTPAHAHADPHICLLGDCDSYETWLGVNDLENTVFWFNQNPSGPSWSKRYTEIPTWNQLSTDLKEQLDMANQVYGGYASGQEFWELSYNEIDPVLFQLSYLMAESGDNFNSGGKQEYPGEFYNGDLGDPTYLSMMRDNLFPLVIEFSTMWIDYFEAQIGIHSGFVYIPIIIK